MKSILKTFGFVALFSLIFTSCRETNEVDDLEALEQEGAEVKVSDDGSKIKIKTDDKKIKIKTDEDGDVKKKIKIDN